MNKAGTYRTYTIVLVVINVILVGAASTFGYFYYMGSAATAGAKVKAVTLKQDVVNEKCIKVEPTDALLIIDVQNDFMPERPVTMKPLRVPIPDANLVNGKIKGGSLAVDQSINITPRINALIDQFEQASATIVYSLDWHPAGHCSHHSHPEPRPVKKGDAAASSICHDNQSLQMFHSDALYKWPVHCVQGTFGAQFDPNLKISQKPTSFVVKKGFWQHFDSYSAFGGMQTSATLAKDSTTIDTIIGEDMTKSTLRLVDLLKHQKVKRVFVVGIAGDYCVRFTIEDAVQEILSGKEQLTIEVVAVMNDAIAAVVPKEMDAKIKGWKEMGVAVIEDSKGKFSATNTCPAA